MSRPSRWEGLPNCNRPASTGWRQATPAQVALGSLEHSTQYFSDRRAHLRRAS